MTHYPYAERNNFPSDEDLVWRAVRGARPHSGSRRRFAHWEAVRDTFALGATFSAALCRRFGLDPDAEVRRS